MTYMAKPMPVTTVWLYNEILGALVRPAHTGAQCHHWGTCTPLRCSICWVSCTLCTKQTSTGSPVDERIVRYQRWIYGFNLQVDLHLAVHLCQTFAQRLKLLLIFLVLLLHVQQVGLECKMWNNFVLVGWLLPVSAMRNWKACWLAAADQVPCL